MNQLAGSPAHVAPFDGIAATYDKTFTDSLIGMAQRKAVWSVMDRTFQKGQRILEVNCGTGVDALHLASRGVDVVACDESAEMIAVARARRDAFPANQKVSFHLVDTEELSCFADQGSFDGCLSNFGGLNCVGDLPAVACNLARLLKPGTKSFLCLLGPRCAWEAIWYLARGDPRKAFRRFKRGGAVAQFGGGACFQVRYYTVREMAKAFSPNFRLLRWKGIGVAVPPSYAEPLACRFPRVVKILAGTDRWLGRCPIARGLADHILLEFERVRI